MKVKTLMNMLEDFGEEREVLIQTPHGLMDIGSVELDSVSPSLHSADMAVIISVNENEESDDE